MASSCDVRVISARQVSKRYGEVVAVDGITLDIDRGEYVGFLGPNGAGKSSLMRMLSGVSRPSGGELVVLGQNMRRENAAVRRRLGIVPQANYLDRDLTVEQNLVTYGRYHGLSRVRARATAAGLLEFAQLQNRGGEKVDSLSGGMQRRLAIARALVNQPEVVLLDEPTTGLDPQARHLLWERLFQLRERGTTVVLTTHYMDEAEQLCDRVIVMDHGRIVAEGHPRELIDDHAAREVVELRFGDLALASVEAKLDNIGQRIEVLSDRILVFTEDGDAALAEIQERRISARGVLIRRGTLEDVFLRLTGRELEE